MSNKTDANLDTHTEKKTSKLARVAFYNFLAGIGCVFTIQLLVNAHGQFGNMVLESFYYLGLAAWAFGVLIGIAAVIDIIRNFKTKSGFLHAVPAIVIPPVVVIGLYASWVVALNAVCTSELASINKVLILYAQKNNGNIPDANWCDLLIAHADIKPYMFRSKCSDATLGESSFAINKNIIGLEQANLPKNVVVLFETDFGKSASRPSNNHIQIKEVNGVNRIVRKKGADTLRWNQCGGVKIATGAHHRNGMNVLFADGHIEFVKTKDFNSLRWKP